jgi:hypothetical protein
MRCDSCGQQSHLDLQIVREKKDDLVAAKILALEKKSELEFVVSYFQKRNTKLCKYTYIYGFRCRN